MDVHFHLLTYTMGSYTHNHITRRTPGQLPGQLYKYLCHLPVDVEAETILQFVAIQRNLW